MVKRSNTKGEKMKKVVIYMMMIAFVVSMLFTGIGCEEEAAPAEETAEEAAPAEEVTEEEAEEEAEGKVVLVIRTGVEADGLRASGEAYTEKTGIEVEITEVGREGYFATVPTQLLGGTSDFDVVFFLSTSIAEMAEAGVLEPIDDYINNPDLTDPAEYDSEDILATYGYKDKTYGLPTTISTHYLYYREDLIENPPQTWDEHFEVAKNFTKSINPDSPTTYGALFDCLPGEELPKSFYSVLYSFKGDIIDEDGNVVINSPEAVEAANQYLKYIDAGILPEDILSYGFSDVFEALQTGEVAMAGPFWDAAMGGILIGDSPFKDSIKVTLIQGVKDNDEINRVPFQHSWCLVLNKNSKNLEGAWKFLNYATGKEGGKIVTTVSGSSPSRISLLTDPELLAIFPHYALHAESLKIAKSEPSVVFYPQMHDAMNTALTKIITGEMEPQAAFDEAASTIQAMLEAQSE